MQTHYKECCGQHMAGPMTTVAASVSVDGADDVDGLEELGERIYPRSPVVFCCSFLGTKLSLRYAQQKGCISDISK